MSHDPHTDSPHRILHDGCGECEQRGMAVHVALGHLDPARFEQAWKRAAGWQQGRLDFAADGGIGHAEAPLLRALWAVQVQLERRGLPIGQVPAW